MTLIVLDILRDIWFMSLIEKLRVIHYSSPITKHAECSLALSTFYAEMVVILSEDLDFYLP